MKRFLIFNPFGIGDVLFSTPLLRALKDHFPDSFLGYVCNQRTKQVLETNPLIDRIFVYEKDDFRALWKTSKWGTIKAYKRLFKEICNEKFEVLLDLSLAPEVSFVLACAGIPKRVGLNYKKRGRFLTDRVFISGFDDKSIAEYYFELLKPLGVKRNGKRYRIELWLDDEDEGFASSFFKTDQLKGDVVGIVPGGGAAFGPQKRHYRQWNPTSFAAVCDLLWEKLGVESLVFSVPGEEEITEQLYRNVKRKPVIAKSTSVRQMASLMKRCRTVVCSCGGPLHVAVSTNVPLVALFGPTDPIVYGPYGGDEDRFRILTQPVVCSPCYRRFKLPECAQNVCLQWITPERVLEEITFLFEKLSIKTNGTSNETR